MLHVVLAMVAVSPRNNCQGVSRCTNVLTSASDASSSTMPGMGGLAVLSPTQSFAMSSAAAIVKVPSVSSLPVKPLSLLKAVSVVLLAAVSHWGPPVPVGSMGLRAVLPTHRLYCVALVESIHGFGMSSLVVDASLVRKSPRPARPGMGTPVSPSPSDRMTRIFFKSCAQLTELLP